jgi:tetratricopeptide (TPR) repeat protein
MSKLCIASSELQNWTPSWGNRYNLALALLYDGQPAEASTLLAALHTERPEHADTLMFLGSAYEAQQKMPEALEAYRAAAIADPSNPDRTLDYTRLLMDMDRYDEAIEFIQTDMTETAATSPLKLRLGAVQMIKGDYAAAREAFQAALAENPELDAGYVGLAQTYARQTNDAEAIKILEAARSKRPGSYSAGVLLRPAGEPPGTRAGGSWRPEAGGAIGAQFARSRF